MTLCWFFFGQNVYKIKGSVAQTIATDSETKFWQCTGMGILEMKHFCKALHSGKLKTLLADVILNIPYAERKKNNE